MYQARDRGVLSHAPGYRVTENADADVRRLTLDPQIGVSWEEKRLCKRNVLRMRRVTVATDRERKHYRQNQPGMESIRFTRPLMTILLLKSRTSR